MYKIAVVVTDILIVKDTFILIQFTYEKFERVKGDLYYLNIERIKHRTSIIIEEDIIKHCK